MGMIGENLIDEIVDPSDAPDAGVRVRMGPPVPVMLAAEHDTTWGLFNFPSIWGLRDGRLVCEVTMGEDELTSDSDYHYLWYVSDDGGEHWTHAVLNEEEVEDILRERVTLPNGRQIYYEAKMISLDAIDVAPYPFDAAASGFYGAHDGVEVVYRLGDLPEAQRCVTMYSRGPDEHEWRRDRAFMDGDCLLPVFKEKVLDHDSPSPLTHGYIATRLRNLVRYMGDDRQPDVGLLEHYAAEWMRQEDLERRLPGNCVARVRIPPPFLLRLHMLSHEPYVELADGDLILAAARCKVQLALSDAHPGRERYPNIYRSSDGGRSWSYYSSIPYDNLGPYELAWPLITPDMPAGNWVALCRSNGFDAATANGPLVLTRSYDKGLTWTQPVAIRAHSVNPVATRPLANGVVFRVYGRPGQFITFCSDGEGKLWGNDVTLMPPGPVDPTSPRGHMERSCCNSDIYITGPDRFLIVYTDYLYEDPAAGRTRKAVLVREVVAEPV